MDLRQQLHDAMWVRVLFTLALLTGVLWVQIDHHGVVIGEVLVGVAIVALVNLPMYIVERRLPTRTAAAIIVVSDLALVTVAVIFAGGALSAVGIFYVWPIVLSAVFLPAWAPYAAAGAASAAYVAVWELQHVGWLDVSALVAEIQVPPNWMLITVFLHVAAFMLVALLSGRLAQALIGSTAQLTGAKADTEEQLRRMQATNEQLRAMSESSRVFLRHQDVGAPHPRGARPDRRGHRPAQRLRAHPQPQHAATSRSARSPASMTPDLVRRYKELGIVEIARTGAERYVTVTDAAGRPDAQGHGEGRLPRLPRGAARGQARGARRRLPAAPRQRGRARGGRPHPQGAQRPGGAGGAQHPVQRGAGAQERGAHPPRPAQERLHGHHEPRAAHAAHVDHRLQRHAAQRHDRRAQREAVGVRRQHPQGRRVAAQPHQRRPRPHQDRGGPPGAQPRSGRPAGGPPRRPPGGQATRAGQAHPHLDLPAHRPAARVGRPRQAQPDPAEPHHQRHQVHARERQRERRGAHPGRARGDLGQRHRHRHREGGPGQGVPAVHADRLVGHALAGRDRAGTGHRPRAGGAARRHDPRAEQSSERAPASSSRCRYQPSRRTRWRRARSAESKRRCAAWPMPSWSQTTTPTS